MIDATHQKGRTIDMAKYAEVWEWQGPGWYAGIITRIHVGDKIKEVTKVVRLGTDKNNPPQTYGTGYGTVTWHNIMP